MNRDPLSARATRMASLAACRASRRNAGPERLKEVLGLWDLLSSQRL